MIQRTRVVIGLCAFALVCPDHMLFGFIWQLDGVDKSGKQLYAYAAAEARSRTPRRPRVRTKLRTRSRLAGAIARRKVPGRRSRARRTQLRPSLVAPRPVPLTAEALLLKRKFGGAFLAKLQSLGVTAKTFIYANRLATVGVKNFYKLEYADAMYLFNKAYKLVPSPNLLYYMAITYDKLGSYLKSKRQLEKYLREVDHWTLTPIKKSLIAKARSALASVSKKLITLRLSVNVAGADIFINGETIGKSPHLKVIWLMPGRNTVVVVKKGYVKKEVILQEKRIGVTVKRSIELLTPVAMVRRDKLFQEAERRKREAEARRRKVQRQLRLARVAAEQKARRNQKVFRISGYSALGTAVAALLAAGVLAIVAEGEENKLGEAERGDTWLSVSDNKKRADDFRKVAFGLTGGAAALSIASAVLLAYGYRTSRVDVKERHTPKSTRGSILRLQVFPTIGPNRAGVTLGLRF